METCDVVVCDVDGVINIFADDSFDWDDVTELRFFHDSKPLPLFTFSPTVANALTALHQIIPFFWLTSWNEKTALLTKAGFPKANILNVERDRETESKIEHVIALAKTKRVLWIDDFAQEWRSLLPNEILSNVVSLQPDHKQGISENELQKIKIHCGLS